MKALGSRFILAALLAVLVALAGCSDDTNSLAPAPAADTTTEAFGEAMDKDMDDIVDTAIGAGIFQTLVAAVGAAELEDALRAAGPYTVFAPTDEAFGKLPDGLVDQLLLERNKAKLQELLLYHVLGDEVFKSELRRFQFAETLNGKYLWIRKLWGGTVKVNDARVVLADVDASNGVVHAIDKVLIPRGFELEPEVPAPTLDIVDTAVGANVFNTLVTAVGAAELVDALRSEGPFTVFAPTDDAFAMLPSELITALLQPENKAKLQELLLYHVVDGQVLSGDLRYYQRVTTKSGGEVSIVKWFGNVWVNWSRVTTPDVLATNGVIHIIHRVLIPRGFTLEMNGTVYEADALEEMVDRASNEELPPTEFETRYLDVQ
jgi:uncharacterized surface protein with fasciclin (FAS1) repeats